MLVTLSMIDERLSERPIWQHYGLLSAAGRHKLVQGTWQHTTSLRCVLLGLLSGVKFLNKPCELRIITLFSKEGLAEEVDLFSQLLTLIEAKDITVEFSQDNGGKIQLKRHIQTVTQSKTNG